MRNTSYGLALAVFIAGAAPAFAHHSFVAEFDGSKTFVIRGVLSDLEWTNPHILFWVDVTDADGNIDRYSFLSGPPGTLRNAGISKKDFRVGETVTVTGAPAKDGTHHGWLKMIKYDDGQLFVYRDGSE